MVADFVGHRIGLGEIAGGFETVMELAKEGEVDINFLIVAAIEGAGCSRSETAGGLDLAVRKARALALRTSSGALEYFAPSCSVLPSTRATNSRPSSRTGVCARVGSGSWRDVWFANYLAGSAWIDAEK